MIRFFLLLFFSSSFLFATLTITDKSNKFDNFEVLFYHDINNTLDIHTIQTINFTQTVPNQFALGYHAGSAWFKLTLTNNSTTENFILYFSEPFWSEFNFYQPFSHRWRVEKNGLLVPLVQRQIQDNNPAFAFSLTPGETKTYYIQGSSHASFIGELQLFTQDEYFRPSRLSITEFHIFYSAILFFMMLLIAFLFFIVRERIYVYYIGYVLSFLVWVSCLSATYLSFGLKGWDEGVHAVGTLVVFFLVLFSREFLNLKKFLPTIATLFKTLAIMFLLFTFAITMKIPYASLLFNIVSSLFFTLLLIVSIKAWRENYTPTARYYLLALIIYMPSMGMMTLTYNGLIPNQDFTRYAFVLGSFTEIVFFSFVLASRYQEIKSSALLVEKELLHEKEKNEHYLKEEVSKRTTELLNVNQRLAQQAYELEQAKKELTVEATTDALSQLYNRRYFTEIASHIFQKTTMQRQNLSLLMIDIDKFKEVNDTYGHDIGDKAIVCCADIFKKLARSSDIVTRYGGEEFIILLPATALKDALVFAERVRSKIETQMQCQDFDTLKLTVSIGVTQMVTEDKAIEDLVKRSDEALYKAKNAGRNRVVSL